MPRHQRLEDVACAICMDALFNRKDDLDEIMQIATPDCGHVFHETCLLEWFKAQSQQYIANLRGQRDTSPTTSEAPAECPTCRTECFADSDTGQPIIHRLFINFGGDDAENTARGFGSSSQAPMSSPARWGDRKRSEGGKKDKEVLGMARRARGLINEVEGLSPESLEDDVEGMLRRAEGLKDDILSTKALAGIKTYVGGLTASINKLRNALETHPLLPTLCDRTTALQAEITRLESELVQYHNIVIPQQIRRAVQAEQAKTERRIKKVQEETELVQRELEKEQVARRASSKEMIDRERKAQMQLATMKSALEREEKERKQLNDTLHERTKLLRLYQSKAESRKALKNEIEILQAENIRLKSQAANPLNQPALSENDVSQSSKNAHSSPGEQPTQDIDISIEEIPASVYKASQRKPHRRNDMDESLQIDMPSFRDDDFGLSSSSTNQLAGPSTIRLHPTARTFSFDLETDDLLDHSNKRRATDKLSTASKPTSKYFTSPSRSGSSRRRSDILVGASSSPSEFSNQDIGFSVGYEKGNVRDSLNKKSRTNPFTTTKEESEKRKRLDRLVDDLGIPKRTLGDDIVDLTEDDSSLLGISKVQSRPYEIGLNSESRLDVGGFKRVRDIPSQPPLGGQRSMVDFLGISDGSGRPRKGVAIGTKMKRKA